MPFFKALSCPAAPPEHVGGARVSPMRRVQGRARCQPGLRADADPGSWPPPDAAAVHEETGADGQWGKARGMLVEIPKKQRTNANKEATGE